MSAGKHTPGPWEAKHREGSDGMYRTEVYSAEHGGIATCAWTPKNCGHGVTETYREANARLIAAAPDLLEQLCLMVQQFAQYVPPAPNGGDEAWRIAKARAAIAKAVQP